MKKSLLLFAICSMGVISCTNDKGEAPTLGCTPMSYTADIMPIVTAKCATTGCHVSGGTGTGDFTTYAGFKAKVDGGQLNNRLYIAKDMPPGGSPQLSQEELDKIKCWMEQGAQNN
jgi:hypothetical protein